MLDLYKFKILFKILILFKQEGHQTFKVALRHSAAYVSKQNLNQNQYTQTRENETEEQSVMHGQLGFPK